MALTVAIAADHGGFELKNQLASWLKETGCNVCDLGAEKYDQNDDYPDFALELAQFVTGERAERGILICGSGVGACVTANKIPGARAAICHDDYSAHQGVEHDDINILCLGARVIGEEKAKKLVSSFLGATFSGEERHCRRLAKLLDIESRFSRNAV